MRVSFPTGPQPEVLVCEGASGNATQGPCEVPHATENFNVYGFPCPDPNALRNQRLTGQDQDHQFPWDITAVAGHPRCRELVTEFLRWRMVGAPQYVLDSVIAQALGDLGTQEKHNMQEGIDITKQEHDFTPYIERVLWTLEEHRQSMELVLSDSLQVAQALICPATNISVPQNHLGSQGTGSSKVESCAWIPFVKDEEQEHKVSGEMWKTCEKTMSANEDPADSRRACHHSQGHTMPITEVYSDEGHEDQFRHLAMKDFSEDSDGDDDEYNSGKGVSRGGRDTMAAELNDLMLVMDSGAPLNIEAAEHMVKSQFRDFLLGLPSDIYEKKQKHKLPPTATAVLHTWWKEHESSPYPTEAEKAELETATGLTMKQLNNWFVNKRKRQWRQGVA